MNIEKIKLDSYPNDFNEELTVAKESEENTSILFSDFTDDHLLHWKEYDYIVLFNIYHTYMGDGIILYIKHPNQNNLKNLYINILNSLFENKFGVFGPLNSNFYKLHINGKSVAVAYHDTEGVVDGSLIFIPKLSLLEGYTPKYQTEDDVINILSKLSI